MATTTSNHGGALRRLLHAAVSGDRGSMAELVTDDVVGWSPNLSVTSRGELLEALEGRDDAFSGIEIGVQALDEIGDKAIAEWHVAVDHTGPLVVDDDVVIEATGRRLHLSGATFAEFDGDRICAFRSYFDDLALVEQALAAE
jgi:ketosteroid isomerase-like protein